MRLIFANLETACADGGNMEARANMLQAAFLAGSAFTKSYVGYVHAVAHSLGGQYNVPHGLANAVLLPNVLEFYGEAAYQPLHRLAVVAGVASAGDSPRAGAERFIQPSGAWSGGWTSPPPSRRSAGRTSPGWPGTPTRRPTPSTRCRCCWTPGSWNDSTTRSWRSEMNQEQIRHILDTQRAYFSSGATLPVEKRVQALQRLRTANLDSEAEINAALKADLGQERL